MRAIFNLCYKHFIVRNNVFKSQVRRLETPITGDKVITLNESTLTGRLLIYLNNNKPQDDKEQHEITEKVDVSKYASAGTLKKLDIKTLSSGFSLLATRHYFNKSEFQRSLDIFDGEYCRRLSNQLLNKKDIFEILHVYMKIISNRITKTIFFKRAMKKLSENVDNLSKSDLIELLFFIGLKKKFAKNDTTLGRCMYRISESYLNDLTTEELCVICNSTFKTRTKIDDKLFLDKIGAHLLHNLHLLKDPALFVTLIKTIRHNRYQTEDLVSTISCTIFFNNTLGYYSFTAICHILALYSDFLYYDEYLLRTTVERCLELLKTSKMVSKEDYFLDTIRIKDIIRLLWCLSNLNCKCLEVKVIKENIIPSILTRLELGDSEGNFASMVDIMLYLWMLNYRAYELVPYALTKEKIRIMRETPSLDQSRLNLLLSCIQYEDPELHKQLKIHPQPQIYNTKYQLQKRPLLRKVLNNLRYIAKQHDIKKFEIGCQIPGLNIIGITGYQGNMKKTVHIEILDEYTSLKNVEDMPTGLMELKLRLLNETDEGVIVINSEDLDSVDDDEFREILLDEINLVC